MNGAPITNIDGVFETSVRAVKRHARLGAMSRWCAIAIALFLVFAAFGCRKGRAGGQSQPAPPPPGPPYAPRLASSSVRWVVSEGGAAGFLPAPESGPTSFFFVGDANGARSAAGNGKGQFTLTVQPPFVCKVLRALTSVERTRLSLDVRFGSVDRQGVECIRAFAPSALSFDADTPLTESQVDLLTHLDGCEALGASASSDEIAKLLGGRASEPALGPLRTVNLVMGRMSAEGFASLARLQSLREVGLRGTSTTSRPTGIGALAKLPALERLDLSYGSVTDDDLASFSATTTLRWLMLESSEVGDAGVIAVATAAKDLEYINLSSTKITDTAVRVIAKLPRLRWLRLHGTHVTAQVLEALSSSTSLEILELPASASGPSVEAYRAAHPKVALQLDP